MPTFLVRIGFLTFVAAAWSCTSSNSASSAGGDCKTACARIAAPNCPGTKPGCEEECTKSAGTCVSERSAYLSCATTATFTCNAQGNPEAAACATQVQAYGRCFLTGGSDAGVDAQCDAICRSVQAQACPGDQDADCGLGCMASKDFYAASGCSEEGAALQSCQASATSWTCRTDGAVAEECATAQMTLSACISRPQDAGADAP